MSRNIFSNWMALRIIVGLLALPLTAFVLLLAAIQIQRGFDWVHTAVGVPLGILATLCWQFVIWGNDPTRRHQTAAMILGGALLGGTSAGMALVGAGAWMPDTNLGPMLGFLIVGPIGFVAGVVLGAYWCRTASCQRL